MAAVSGSFARLQGPCCYQPAANSQSKTWRRTKSALNQATESTKQHRAEQRRKHLSQIIYKTIIGGNPQSHWQYSSRTLSSGEPAAAAQRCVR